MKKNNKQELLKEGHKFFQDRFDYASYISCPDCDSHYLRCPDEQEFRRLVNLKKVTKNILRDHKEKFKVYPASISYHYNYQNGLIEQTVSLLKVAKQIGSHYDIDIDLLISGVCLHQIGKLYSINLGSSISKSNHKSLVGNAILSRDIVNKYISEVKNFPEDDKLSLEHLILSYQGRKEWQSPVEPQTIEAILLHSINFIDSKINFMRRDEL